MASNTTVIDNLTRRTNYSFQVYIDHELLVRLQRSIYLKVHLPCPYVQVGQMFTSFLHHNQIFDIIITFSKYDVKNLIIMQKALGL